MPRLFKTGITSEGDISTSGKVNVTASSGDEGGEIFLNKAATNTTLTGGVTIDVFQNRLRFFEQGGSARGYYLDISTGGTSVGTNLVGTATSVSNTVTGTNSADLVYGNMADNDQFRIRVGGTATNAGFVEIATADDGTEPIHVRQYSGVFTTLVRTATLLDSSGNTTFPGTLSAVSKSFLIDHPTKPGMKLRYGSLEGPENGVYIRGRSKDRQIELPEYWTELVDESTITVTLTPIGKRANLYIKDVKNNKIFIGGKKNVEYFYVVFAERKDIPKLIVEE
jgi:hypothetical protein